jgi:predicted RNA binding protein YcfA (HicA-like mRNA interferase family)
MTGVDKIIAKMKNQPNGIRFDELRKVLEHNGYTLVRVKGSHHAFQNGSYTYVVPKHNPVKATYVADVLDLIGE